MQRLQTHCRIPTPWIPSNCDSSGKSAKIPIEPTEPGWRNAVSRRIVEVTDEDEIPDSRIRLRSIRIPSRFANARIQKPLS